MKFKYRRLRAGSEAEDSLGNSLDSHGSALSSDEDNNNGSEARLQPQWCQLAYWEECNRVGRLHPVSSSHIEVFSLLPKSKGRHESSEAGLCLATLFKQNKSPSESTAKTREKIGQGILLSHVENGVWVYNRTSNPIFVNSPTLEPSPDLSSVMNENNPQDNFTVIRVSPGYSIQVFDYQKSDFYERIRHSKKPLGMPFDPYSIRISFAKGWGTKYSRQVVTNCPCWLEILLTVHR